MKTFEEAFAVVVPVLTRREFTPQKQEELFAQAVAYMGRTGDLHKQIIDDRNVQALCHAIAEHETCGHCIGISAIILGVMIGIEMEKQGPIAGGLGLDA